MDAPSQLTLRRRRGKAGARHAGGQAEGAESENVPPRHPGSVTAGLTVFAVADSPIHASPPYRSYMPAKRPTQMLLAISGGHSSFPRKRELRGFDGFSGPPPSRG